MPALQANATTFNPNNLDLTLVASYDRKIRTNTERIWENVLDWEHLPHLHHSSFNYVDLDEAGDWGWRTWSNPDRTAHIELCIDETQYVARSYQADNQVSEIWTYLTPCEDKTDIHVEFYAVDITQDASEKVGKLYLGLYQRLWDEDEEMMLERQLRLTESRNTVLEMDLGPREKLVKRLPLVIQLKRGEFQIMLREDKLIAFSTICPHLLGPLSDVDVASKTLTCPWHGYRFDMRTGECLSPDDASCKLPTPPTIVEDSGNIILKYQESLKFQES